MNADANGLDGFPHRASGTLARERAEHLRWDGAEDGRQRKTIFLVLDLVAVLRLDGVLQALGLHVHRHQQCPLLVVGAREHGVNDVAAGLGNEALDDGRPAATAAAWRRRDREVTSARRRRRLCAELRS